MASNSEIFLRNIPSAHLAQRRGDVINVCAEYVPIIAIRGGKAQHLTRSGQRGNLYCANLLKQWNFLIFCTNIDSYGCAKNRVYRVHHQWHPGSKKKSNDAPDEFLAPST